MDGDLRLRRETETPPGSQCGLGDARPNRQGGLQGPAFYSALAFCALVVLAERIYIGQKLPLWLDESWTAMIATRPSWAALWREIWLDSNAPLHYVLTWFWPFKSADGLRLLSGACMLATGLLPLVYPSRLTFQQRAAWGALLFLWAPGQLFSVDARPYALLMLLSTAQTIAFIGLLDAPGRKRAAIWCGLGAATILTHYFAAFLGAAQGIAYLIVHRGRAIRTWPALVALLPAVGIAAWHLPRELVWASPGVSWYARMSAADGLTSLLAPLGPTLFTAGVAIAILGLCRLRPPDQPTSSPARISAVASVACLVVLIGAGMAFPFLVNRYLTPEIPGALLGVALLARHRIGCLTAAVCFLLSHNPVQTERGLHGRARYGVDLPSQALVAASPDLMVFASDWVGAKAADPQTMAAIGERTFREAGLNTRVKWVITGADPAGDLLSAADGRRPSIIWISSRGVWPEIEKFAPDWRCVRWSNTFACAPRRIFPPA
jgi:hypothetical protein